MPRLPREPELSSCGRAGGMRTEMKECVWVCYAKCKEGGGKGVSARPPKSELLMKKKDPLRRCRCHVDLESCAV